MSMKWYIFSLVTVYRLMQEHILILCPRPSFTGLQVSTNSSHSASIYEICIGWAVPSHLHPCHWHSTSHAQLGCVLEEGASSGGCRWPGYWPLTVVP